MKQSIATLALLFSLTLAGSSAHAATTVASCPAGYICTRTSEITPPVCPTGYVCRLNSSTSGTQNSANTANTGTAATSYVPGSYYNSYFGGLNSGVANNNTIPNLGGNQSWSTLYASTTATSTASYVYSTPGATAMSVGEQVNAIIARIPATWTATDPFVQLGNQNKSSDIVASTFGYYATDKGQHLKSMCGANQFLNMLVKPYGCIDNFATNAPIVLNPAVPFDPNSEPLSDYTVTDPYCSGVTAATNSGSPIMIRDTSSNNRDSSPNYNSLVQKQNCVVGEAYKNQPYINPWVTVNNLYGLVKVSHQNPTTQKNTVGSNYCENSISLVDAKKRNDELLAGGIHSDLYTSNARLYAPFQFSLYDAEMYLRYVYAPIGQNKGMYLWWNGAESNYVHSEDFITIYKIGDIKNPEFLALFNSLQVGSLKTGVVVLERCLDTGYISNLPGVAGHYQAEIMRAKSLGLIQ